jgi:tRNA(adenine34) deaminase
MMHGLMLNLRSGNAQISAPTGDHAGLMEVVKKAGLTAFELEGLGAMTSEPESSKLQTSAMERLLRRACDAMRLHPLECLMVGTSVEDARAARATGIAFVGVTGGATSAASFRRQGARAIATSVQDLQTNFNVALERCDRTQVVFDDARLNAMLDEALLAAAEGMANGEAPIGAALFNAQGSHLVSGHNRSLALGDPTDHAEMDAFRALAARRIPLRPGTILVSTLEPCVMCFGAAMEVGIDVLVYGLSAPADGGLARVRPPSSPNNLMCRAVGGIRAQHARELFVLWRNKVATPAQLPYIDQLLASTHRDGSKKTTR